MNIEVCYGFHRLISMNRAEYTLEMRTALENIYRSEDKLYSPVNW